MGLQINTNVAAMNAYRNLSGTQNAMSTSLERLSSGLRINRAADDAAGLAISEKLRAQTSGLNQATSNAQDGISLIQTAEGALNETHSILQRMRQLAVQSANDTNSDKDRAPDPEGGRRSSATELDRIADTTQFNGKDLLDGTVQPARSRSAPTPARTSTVTITKMDASSPGHHGSVTLPMRRERCRHGDAASTLKGSFTIAASGDVLDRRHQGR